MKADGSFQLMRFHRNGKRRVSGEGDLIRFQRREDQRSDHPFPAVNEQFDAFLVHEQPQGELSILHFGLHVAGMGDIPMRPAVAPVKDQFTTRQVTADLHIMFAVLGDVQGKTAAAP